MANPLLLAATLACAPAPHIGEIVRVADEQAVIVWNSVSKTEHFIRRARFTTEAKDFGFLVPTPSKPVLAAADDKIFAKLTDATRPEERTETGIALEPSLSCLVFMRPGTKSAAPEAQHVTVIEVARVAGYDAAVLAADDAGALATWLDEHGYPSSPALKSWLDPYVKSKWIVTAFKVARAKDAGDVGTSAVRMTFATDKPFYPYREPEDQRTGPAESRTLDVFLISDSHMEGVVNGGPWNAHTMYARQDIDVSALLAGIPDVQPRAWLHRFLDVSSPRPGTHDLFFDATPQGEVVPPAIVHDRRVRIPVPLDLVILVVAAVVLTVRLLRRRPT